MNFGKIVFAQIMQFIPRTYAVDRMGIQKKYQPKTAHNTFFLILYEMGVEDKDLRRIMGITQEAIRSTRYRIQQGGKK